MNDQPKLTYEQWCERFMVNINQADVDDAQLLHGLDLRQEIEQARRVMYDEYIKGEF